MEKTKKDSIKYTITTIIAVIGLVISGCNFYTLQQTQTVNYHVVPNVKSYENGKIMSEIEINVTSGSVGDITFLDYRDGELKSRQTNKYGKINNSSNKDERTFEMEYTVEEKKARFLISQYALVNGNDGSRHLDLILYVVDDTDESKRNATANCYTRQDLALLELQEDTMYKVALEDYRKLFNILQEKGEL